MYKINFTPRNYQEEISNTATSNNTLVVLPTGTGKTKISILTSIKIINKNPDSKYLFLTPTKPLAAQIQKEFIESTDIPFNKIALLTGATTPKKREKIWHDSTIIVATPQTIEKDLEKNRIYLDNVSLLTIDECHRSKMKFANTVVSKKYIEEAKNPRILALTASPGGTKESIEEIRNNLFIETIEIRTEEDIKEFIQKKEIKWFEVELQRELKELLKLIKTPYKENLKHLRKLGFNKPTNVISKRDLLMLQNLYRSQKTQSKYYGIFMTAQLLKLDYASELLETQGLNSLSEYWKKLSKEETKAAKTIMSNKDIQKAMSLTNELMQKNIKHPKLYLMNGIIKKEIIKNPNSKIIIFANYRNTIDEIVNSLNLIENINATKLIGQKLGLKQKEQIQTIKDFEDNKYNILVCSQIGEEGLDVAGGELVIFYDVVASEIRSIQRRGRVGRTKAGRIIFLVTNGTREQGYKWSAIQKEKKMKNTLKKMQESN